MIKLDLNITKKETQNLWNDILKFNTIILIVHLLQYAIDDNGELFSEEILKLLLYVTISLVIYNLVIKRTLVNQ